MVIDDRGPESGEPIVREFNDSRISFHQNDRNLGIAGNWNRCLDLATTDYVTLLHADDELEPDYVARMTTTYAAFPAAAAIFCQARVIDADGRVVFSFPDAYKKLTQGRINEPRSFSGEPALRAIARGNFIMCPTLCYRKSALGALRFDEARRMVMDLHLTTSLLLNGQLLVGIPDTLYRYRRHGENMTDLLTKDLRRFQEEDSIYSDLARECAKRGWNQAARIFARKAIVKLNLYYQMVKDLRHGHFASAFNKLTFAWRMKSTRLPS